MSKFATELRYYLNHQVELFARYPHMFVVIKGEKVLGAYASALEAVNETSKTHPAGTFLVQRCEDPAVGITQTFHSRTAFA